MQVFCHKLMKSSLLAGFTFAAVACLATHAKAEKAPLSLSELQKSDLIVVGTINRIRIESGPSRFERAPGNYDWHIYVTLAVENVEKGKLADNEIEFRCFRIKYRRSLMEYLTPSGHRPIPGTGTRIRAYLNGGNPNWLAALPNGITASDANEYTSFWASRDLPDAPEIAELRSRRFTYFLPLESRGSVFVVVILTILLVVFTRWFIRQRRTRVQNCNRTSGF